MLITIKDKTNPAIMAEHIRLEVSRSRFTAQVEVIGPSRIKVRQIRLRESKRFCGSHPYACDIENGRKSKCLEGLDWVEWNDRLNDVFDRYGVAAWIRSAVCTIRRGTERRIEYDGELTNPYNNEHTWYREGEMEDWCGRNAPISWYPEGTPGLYEREELNAYEV